MLVGGGLSENKGAVIGGGPCEAWYGTCGSSFSSGVVTISSVSYAGIVAGMVGLSEGLRKTRVALRAAEEEDED